MLFVSTHSRHLLLLVCSITVSLVITLFPMLVVQAVKGFTTQARLGFPAGDDWEPALAADHYGHVYVLSKHYDVAGQTSCSSCALHVLLQISIDRGQTWTGPTIVENLQRATDKDILTVRGTTIAVAYNAAQKIYASISHNGGQTWATQLINSGSSQQGWSLGGGGGIDLQGNIYFSWDGYTQNGQAKGPVNLFVSESRDGGQTWTLTTMGVSGAPYSCSNCGFAFLGAQATMTVGSDDAVYVLWNSTIDQTDYAPERIYFAKSTNHGASYSVRQDVSLAAQGIEHAFPAITTGARSSDVRIAWMDMRTGQWNLFYRASSDGGSTWSGETQVSGYVPGYSYLTPTGFGLPYGDYFEMSVDDQGSTQIAWGEAGSYSGPGNIWTSHD